MIRTRYANPRTLRGSNPEETSRQLDENASSDRESTRHRTKRAIAPPHASPRTLRASLRKTRLPDDARTGAGIRTETTRRRAVARPFGRGWYPTRRTATDQGDGKDYPTTRSGASIRTRTRLPDDAQVARALRRQDYPTTRKWREHSDKKKQDYPTTRTLRARQIWSAWCARLKILFQERFWFWFYVFQDMEEVIAERNRDHERTLHTPEASDGDTPRRGAPPRPPRKETPLRLPRKGAPPRHRERRREGRERRREGRERRCEGRERRRVVWETTRDTKREARHEARSETRHEKRETKRETMRRCSTRRKGRRPRRREHGRSGTSRLRRGVMSRFRS